MNAVCSAMPDEIVEDFIDPADANDEAPETNTIPLACKCDACKMLRFEKSNLKSKPVYGHSFAPYGGWEFKAVAGEIPVYYLGVELETDNFRMENRQRIASRVASRFASDMARPKNFWIAKSDASVSGPEFCSHPASILYWRRHQLQIAEMLKMLVHAGYRSHDTGNAGMHVSFSCSAIGNPAHLERLVAMIGDEESLTMALSQRNRDQVQQWAAMPNSYRSASRYIDDLWNKTLDTRYMALNAPPGEARYEFRIPRGTLRPDRFQKNLEWIVSMIEFTRPEHSYVSTRQYGQFVRLHERQYPNLARFMREKGLGY
jgi:hypothetical protein